MDKQFATLGRKCDVCGRGAKFRYDGACDECHNWRLYIERHRLTARHAKEFLSATSARRTSLIYVDQNGAAAEFMRQYGVPYNAGV